LKLFNDGVFVKKPLKILSLEDEKIWARFVQNVSSFEHKPQISKKKLLLKKPQLAIQILG